MSLLLGIDLGTSYFKVGLFDRSGELRGLGRVAVEVQHPEPGRSELEMKEFWSRLRRALDAALEQANAKASEIVALSYSSQANTLVLLDEDAKALTPLIVWSDRRAHPLSADIVAFAESAAHAEITGLVGIAPERAAAKLSWFARTQPELWARTRFAMTLSDYLTFALTGERVGDASTGALTGLLDLRDTTWSPAALAQFGVDATKLSRPLAAGSLAGRTNARATELLGLPSGVLFAVGALDHHAAALGSGIGVFADASISTGTVLAALVLVDTITPERGCIHGKHTDGKRFYRLAFDPAGAGQLEQYQRDFAPGLSIEALLDRAQRSADGETVTYGSEVLELLERIARAQQGLLQRVAGDTPVEKIAATGGGARSPFWLQIKSDRLARPIITSACFERACLGAALFAAVGAGIYPDLACAAQAMVRRAQEFFPRATVNSRGSAGEREQ